MFGAIEAGGTKWVCAVGEPDAVEATATIPTTTPDETLGRAIDFLAAHEGLAAVGIGSFGPVDLHPASPTWGSITTTPKPGWAHTPVAPRIAEALGVPVAFDTDVNAAALGELRHGAGVGLDSLCYVTVGTGIGGGAVVGGRLVHGLLHPEMGHMAVPHDTGADPFPGSCPYHGDCLEGLASGGAIRERWGRPAPELADVADVWELEAHYLALLVANLSYTLSPERIVLGGGVMAQASLFPLIRERVATLLAGYLRAPELDDLERYVIPPGLGARAGVVGALELARAALSR